LSRLEFIPHPPPSKVRGIYNTNQIYFCPDVYIKDWTVFHMEQSMAKIPKIFLAPTPFVSMSE
jgi:hypothetical protein